MPISMRKRRELNLISKRKATKAESIIGKLFGLESMKERTMENNNQEGEVKAIRIFPRHGAKVSKANS